MSPDREKATPLHWFQYLSVRVLEACFVWMPWRVGRWIARRFGDLGRLTDRPSRRDRVVYDLRQAFPDMGEQEARKTMRGVYRWLSESMFDFRKFARIADKGKAGELLDVVGGENVHIADMETGILFATGHIGAWEVLGLSGIEIGCPALVFARPRRNPMLEEYLLRLRKTTGQKLLPKHGAMRAAIKALKSGENLAALVDQDARRRGIFVEFFGRPASTVTSVARLSYFSGAPVVLIYAQRIPGGNRFRVVIGKPIMPNRHAPLHDEVFRITQAFTSALEDAIRQSPCEWLWLHRRWKTFPGKHSAPGSDEAGSGKMHAQRWGNQLRPSAPASDPTSSGKEA